MTPLDAKLFRDLWHMRGQAVAIAAVMACGIAVMLMTYGAMRTLRDTEARYYAAYRFADVFVELTRAPLAVAAAAARLPGVAAVEPRIVRRATLAIAGLERPASAELVSLPGDREPALNRIALRAGRLPAPGRDELVMSESMASALGYAPGRTIAVTLDGRRRSFAIVGIALSPEFIYVLAPGQIMPDDAAFGILWLDRTVMEAAFDMKGAFNDLAVALAPGASQDDVISRLDRLMARFGGAAAYGRDEQISHAFVAQELDQLGTIATVIPPIFLGVAAFLINMVMTRLIDTEREAIGVLKAFGYGDWEVGRHYLKFTGLVALGGATLGLGLGGWLGAWMTTMYRDYFHFPFLVYRIDPAMVALSLATAFAAAFAGTWHAVRRAVRLAPATAMLPPAPPAFRRRLFDRLGIGRLSVTNRMVLRHIERWPLRACLTGLGVALATMLLVGLLFFFDAIDAMIEGYYYRTDRQDITVGLVERRSERARFELAELPGVLAVEPLLELPVRLRHGALSERMTLAGLEPDSRFRTFVDGDGHAFALPDAGIVLSGKLSELIGASVGDRVEVEMLDGRRHRRVVPVTAVTTEYVGLAAYMARPALERLANLGGVTSLLVAADPAREAALLARLKDLPAVGGITTRRQAIVALRETMARSMSIVIDFYVALGATVAFGVLYNAARIALSERARELGSLRVLGFTRGEVAHVLVGELALLVALALPVGCLLGYGLAFGLSRAMDTKLFRVPFVIEPATYGLAAAAVLAAAVAATAVVLGRLARLDLIATLKTRE